MSKRHHRFHQFGMTLVLFTLTFLRQKESKLFPVTTCYFAMGTKMAVALSVLFFNGRPRKLKRLLLASSFKPFVRKKNFDDIFVVERCYETIFRFCKLPFNKKPPLPSIKFTCELSSEHARAVFFNGWDFQRTSTFNSLNSWLIWVQCSIQFNDRYRWNCFLIPVSAIHIWKSLSWQPILNVSWTCSWLQLKVLRKKKKHTAVTNVTRQHMSETLI